MSLESVVSTEWMEEESLSSIQVLKVYFASCVLGQFNPLRTTLYWYLKYFSNVGWHIHRSHNIMSKPYLPANIEKICSYFFKALNEGNLGDDWRSARLQKHFKGNTVKHECWYLKMAFELLQNCKQISKEHWKTTVINWRGLQIWARFFAE